MKNLLLLFFLFIICTNATAQQLHYIAGTVKDESGKPLPGVEVFLNGTSRLNITNVEGAFNISRLTSGNYELVARLPGREKYYISFTLDKASKFNITLPILAQGMPRRVRPKKAAEVRKAEYLMFEKAFLGQTSNSSRCKIMNPEVLNIYTDPKTKFLRADSGGEFIEIANNALGYQIRYILQDFIMDKKDYSHFKGQIHFQEMEGSSDKRKNWEKARQLAYAGSTQHLLKAIYDGRVEEEGFQIRSLTRILNKDAISESMYLATREKLDSLLTAKALNKHQYNDSISRLGAKAHRSPDFQILSDQIISPFSLIGRQIGTSKELDLKTELYIKYKNERAAWDYIIPYQIRRLKKRDQDGQVSLISVRETMPIIDGSGSLTNPLSLLYTGYLGWERVSDMLPKDYIVDGTATKISAIKKEP